MELLKELFTIHSPSGKEYAMRKFIKSWCKQNLSAYTIKGDRFGNMYITKGDARSYPCVVAHLDQVQSVYPDDYRVYESDDIIFAYSHANRSYCGLGADDKCGIWIALNCLREFDAIKVAFFTSEEVGCVGSTNADIAFFEDTMYIVEPDRRGKDDLIISIGGSPLCSDEFVESIRPQDFGYSPEHGLMTDISELRHNGYPNSCINLSCGYYEPHSDHEYVVKSDLLNALNFVRNIVSTIHESYPCKDLPHYNDYLGWDEEDYLWETLWSYGDVVKSISDDEIYEELKQFTTLKKKKVIQIIREWKAWSGY